MADKKKKKKRVSIRDDDDDDDRHRKLAELGAIPPSENDEEFHKDVEVLSDCPEIDTTRADSPPRRSFQIFLWILLIPIVLLVFFTFSVEFFYLMRFTNCSFYDVVDQLAMFDSTEIEKSLQNMYEICIPPR